MATGKYSKKDVVAGASFEAKKAFDRTGHPACGTDPERRTFYPLEMKGGALNPEQFTAGDNDYWRRLRNGEIELERVEIGQSVIVNERRRMSGIEVVLYRIDGSDRVVACAYPDFKSMFDLVK